MSRQLFGRKTIYTDAKEITALNVCDVLETALTTFKTNQSDIKYLYDYRRGNQDIWQKQKAFRPDINNKIVVNRANEICEFKIGYLIGEPIQYVNRGDESVSDDISLLNSIMFGENKAAKDKEIVDWSVTTGLGYRLILPKENFKIGSKDSPIDIYTLDSRNTFVVRYNGLGNEVLMGVSATTMQDDSVQYDVYTKDAMYRIVDGEIVGSAVNPLGVVPIIEYPINSLRMGEFECVVPLLDALNETVSDRMDSIDTFIQSILVIMGANADDETVETNNTFDAIKQRGGMLLPEGCDVKYLVQELNQSQTQYMKDDLDDTINEICAIPTQADGTSSDSSNNGAVILRNGWQSAEARAKDQEMIFISSEKEFLKIALPIINERCGTNLSVSDVEIRFTRRNYENIAQKSNVLIQMLSNDMIHPRLAFEYCGMFADPELAYMQSMEHYKEAMANEEGGLADFLAKQSEKAENLANAENTEE